jgi:hypothetical protein
MSGLPESRDEAREKALATFMEYFRTNYPGPDTIISRPDWHAPKIFRAVESALKDAGLVASRSETAPKLPPEANELAAALKDAARYRFLASDDSLGSVAWDYVQGVGSSKETTDAMIDGEIARLAANRQGKAK